MKKSVLYAVLLAFLVAPTVAVAAAAHDLNPPSWRGELSTTSQYWGFSTGETTAIQPDGSPVGGNDWLDNTKLEVFLFPGDPPGKGYPSTCWVEHDSGMHGVWQGPAWLGVYVDNHDPKPENEKWLWVQMTWRPRTLGSGERPIFVYFNPPSLYYPVLVGDIDLGDGWIHSTYEWKLDWNPPDEYFQLEGKAYGGINFDELVVDTWCIPEPGTIASLIGFGLTVGFIYWCRRWRRRK